MVYQIDGYLQSKVYVRSMNKHTLYKITDENGDVLLICIYIDDIVYLSSSQVLIEKFKLRMKTVFEMTDLGLLNYFLGLEGEANGRKYIHLIKEIC